MEEEESITEESDDYSEVDNSHNKEYEVFFYFCKTFKVVKLYFYYTRLYCHILKKQQKHIL